MMPVPLPALPPFPSAPSSAQPAIAPSADGVDASMQQAAVQFEGLFIAQMLKAMRQAADAFGDGKGDGEGAAMMDHAYWTVADGIASQRAFGIADALIAQMGAAPTGTGGR